MRSTTRLAAAAAALLLTVSACASDDGDEQSADPTTEATTEAPENPAPEGEAPEGEAPQMPEPDLEGVPDVVAEVNGVDVPREDFVAAYEGQFQQMAMQAQMTGQELDQDTLKQQTADSLVDMELLVQEADARDLTASQEEVDATLQELAEANGMSSTDEILTALGEQGLSEDEVMEQLASQTKLDQLFVDEGGEYSPSEDELQELYDQAMAQQAPPAEGQEAPEPPAFEDVRPQLEQQLTQQHQADVIAELLPGLRESADIAVHL